MTTGWTLFIVLLTAINVVGAVWLLWATSKRAPGEPSPGSDTTGHVWDGDLQEYNNPLPRWWLWLFYLSVLFSLVYLLLYPGLGSWRGTLGWSQESQWQAEVDAADAAIVPLFERFAKLDFDTLRADEPAMQIAQNLFANHCATCHGSDARGAPGFPNLADGDWLYGGGEDTVTATITYGRNGVMPPWASVLSEQDIEEVVGYVLQGAGQSVPQALAAAGAVKFATYCAACHGLDGKGTQAVGAPNLTDDIWLYGGTAEAIREGIVSGRNNMMPAQLELLGPDRVRLLAAYVLGLAPAAATAGPREAPENADDTG